MPLVIRGEKEWLIKNLSLVFSSVSYTGAQPVSFSFPFQRLFCPERSACARTHTRLTTQRWAKLTEVRKIVKFPTAGSQSAHKLLSRSRADAVLVIIRNFAITQKRTYIWTPEILVVYLNISSKHSYWNSYILVFLQYSTPLFISAFAVKLCRMIVFAEHFWVKRWII